MYSSPSHTAQRWKVIKMLKKKTRNDSDAPFRAPSLGLRPYDGTDARNKNATFFSAASDEATVGAQQQLGEGPSSPKKKGFLKL